MSAFPSVAIQLIEQGNTFEEFNEELDRAGFIGHRILRPRVVGRQHSDVSLIPLEAMLIDQNTKRAAGAGYQRGSFDWNTYNYNTEEYGWEEPIDDRTRNIYLDILDVRNAHSRRAIDFVLREFEREAAAAVFNTTTWTGADFTAAAATAWTTTASADPVADVHSAIEKVKTNCGMNPNTIIMTELALRTLSRVAAITDLIKYHGGDDPKRVMPAMLAELFHVDQVLVADSVKNTAAEGASASLSRIWDDTMAMVCRVAETDDPSEACIGRTMIWTGDGAPGPGADGGMAVTTEEYRDETVRSDIIRARSEWDQKILYKECGFLITGVTA